MENNFLTGDTVLTETRKFKWLKDTTGDYLDVETIEIGEYNSISLKRKIPFYRYFINYLLTIFYEKLGIDKKSVDTYASGIFDSIEKGEENQNLDKLADLILDIFIERGFAPAGSSQEVFGSIGCPIEERTIWNKEQILKDLSAYSVSREKMIVYGFGLGMDHDELETFLMKVLEETGLNIWDKKEGLVYIAFKHFPEDSIEFYNKALDIYDNTDITTGENLPAENQDFNTVILQNYINDYLNSLSNIEKLDDDVIVDIVSYHKDLVSENTKRTIKSEFISAFNDIEERLREESNFVSEYASQFEDGYYSVVVINAKYQAEDDIIIGKDEDFIWQAANTKKELTYRPYMDYELAKTEDTQNVEIVLTSPVYKKANEVVHLDPDDKFYDFKLISQIPGLRDIEVKSAFVTEKRINVLLDYLYNEEGLINPSEADLNNEQVEVLDELLRDTIINPESIYNIIENDDLEEITRGRIITLFFIDYYLKNEDLWHETLRTAAKRKRDYLIYMDHKLRNSRLYEYNISNPYEDVLLKIIVEDEPIDVFRDLWAKYLYNINKSRN